MPAIEYLIDTNILIYHTKGSQGTIKLVNIPLRVFKNVRP